MIVPLTMTLSILSAPDNHVIYFFSINLPFLGTLYI